MLSIYVNNVHEYENILNLKNKNIKTHYAQA